MQNIIKILESIVNPHNCNLIRVSRYTFYVRNQYDITEAVIGIKGTVITVSGTPGPVVDVELCDENGIARLNTAVMGCLPIIRPDESTYVKNIPNQDLIDIVKRVAPGRKVDIIDPDTHGRIVSISTTKKSRGLNVNHTIWIEDGYSSDGFENWLVVETEKRIASE